MSRRTTGFTLIEVLVGLSLISLILTLSFSGLYTTSRVWSKGHEQIQKNDDLRLIMSFIRREISQLVPLTRLDGEDHAAHFMGSDDSLHFVSRLPSHRGNEGLYLVSLTLNADYQEQATLIFSYEPFLEVSNYYDVTPSTPHEILLKNILSVKFSYYGRDTPDSSPSWRDNWVNMERFPELIKLQIVGGDTNIPNAIFQVYAQADAKLPQLTFASHE